MIEVLISYAAGTQGILEVCLASLNRHDAGEAFNIVVLAGDNAAFDEAKDTAGEGEEIRLYDSTGARTSSGRHSRMLDAAVRESKCDYLLTLDSDCFPVASGWIAELKRMVDKGAGSAGILWPWVPPPDTVGQSTIEWRIRKNHNWLNTQVACQLLRTDFVRDNHLLFGDTDSDDTNFGLMDKLHSMGKEACGFMVTRCALPNSSLINPEFNRHVCLVFGDKVYHHGGASREVVKEMYVDDGLYGVARKRVIEEKGAEWILLPENIHLYKMDNEEEAAQFKMSMMYQDAARFLEKQNSLFGGGWA